LCFDLTGQGDMFFDDFSAAIFTSFALIRMSELLDWNCVYNGALTARIGGVWSTGKGEGAENGFLTKKPPG
jgi:hypothetical protein